MKHVTTYKESGKEDAILTIYGPTPAWVGEAVDRALCSLPKRRPHKGYKGALVAAAIVIVAMGTIAATPAGAYAVQWVRSAFGIAAEQAQQQGGKAVLGKLDEISVPIHAQQQEAELTLAVENAYWADDQIYISAVLSGLNETGEDAFYVESDYALTEEDKQRYKEQTGEDAPDDIWARKEIEITGSLTDSGLGVIQSGSLAQNRDGDRLILVITSQLQPGFDAQELSGSLKLSVRKNLSQGDGDTHSQSIELQSFTLPLTLAKGQGGQGVGDVYRAIIDEQQVELTIEKTPLGSVLLKTTVSYLDGRPMQQLESEDNEKAGGEIAQWVPVDGLLRPFYQLEDEQGNVVYSDLSGYQGFSEDNRQWTYAYEFSKLAEGNYVLRCYSEVPKMGGEAIAAGDIAFTMPAHE